MELRGEVRRGYFIRGLSGMQYALPEAADMLRTMASAPVGARLVLLNACDPAQPYGPGLEPPHVGIDRPRMSRIPTNFVVYLGGTPLLWIEAGGTRLWSMAGAKSDDLREGVQMFLVRWRNSTPGVKRLIVEYWNGVRPAESPWNGLLRELGFRGDRNQTMSRERDV
jgi:ATP-dependent Lhr-like helicase